MRVITLNVNGIRSAAKKGLYAWLGTQQADVICLQEIRADLAVFDSPQFSLPGYHCYLYPAMKSGYSGVAIYSRHEPKALHRGLGWACADEEGRHIRIDFDALSIVSLYLPSGSSGEDRQAVKFDFLRRYLTHLSDFRQQGQEILIAGDWNIAHKAIDLKNWRGNQKNSGFLPEERAWLDYLFENEGFVDAFRVINQEPDQYTWWSNRGRAWDNNVGWRIDYQITTPKLATCVQAAHIYKETRFSDHAPLIIDYDFPLGSG